MCRNALPCEDSLLFDSTAEPCERLKCAHSAETLLGLLQSPHCQAAWASVEGKQLSSYNVSGTLLSPWKEHTFIQHKKLSGHCKSLQARLSRSASRKAANPAKDDLPISKHARGKAPNARAQSLPAHLRQGCSHGPEHDAGQPERCSQSSAGTCTPLFGSMLAAPHSPLAASTSQAADTFAPRLGAARQPYVPGAYQAAASPPLPRPSPGTVRLHHSQAAFRGMLQDEQVRNQDLLHQLRRTRADASAKAERHALQLEKQRKAHSQHVERLQEQLRSCKEDLSHQRALVAAQQSELAAVRALLAGANIAYTAAEQAATQHAECAKHNAQQLQATMDELLAANDERDELQDAADELGAEVAQLQTNSAALQQQLQHEAADGSSALTAQHAAEARAKQAHDALCGAMSVVDALEQKLRSKCQGKEQRAIRMLTADLKKQEVVQHMQRLQV